MNPNFPGSGNAPTAYHDGGNPQRLPDRRPARVVNVAPAYNPADHVPPPPPMPTLTVNARGTLYLHAGLVQALGLRHGQPINLRPPEYGSLFWHLDLRPHAPCRVLWHNNTRVRALGIKLPPGLVTDALTLHLMPGQPAYEHYHPLLPANAFTAH